MAYEKRICILKQIKKGFSADGSALSGVVYAERTGETLRITLRLPGLSALKEGRYMLVLQIGGQKFCLPVEEEILPAAPSVKNGFAALLVFFRSEAEPVAFGACGSERADPAQLLKFPTEAARKKPIPTPLPPTQIPASPAPNIPTAPGVPLPDPPKDRPFRDEAVSYDDEAIADADYFSPSHADEGGEAAPLPQAEKAAGGGTPAEDEASFPRGTLTYYGEVREELMAVLKKYPPDTRLKWAFPQSEWVRNGGSLIGIVYEEGIPRYLCVATSGTPEPALREHSVFVPASPYSDEEGFYVVFQDADTGAYVTVSEG